MTHVDTSFLNNPIRLEQLSKSTVDKENMEKAAQDFETMIFGHLVKYMFESTENSSLWGEGHAAGMLRSMFIDAMANSGGAKCLNIRPQIIKSLGTSFNDLKGEIDVSL